MSPEEWVAVVGSEYLNTYVRQGGAAVKFAAASTDAGRAELRERLAAAAEAHGFQLAILDATEVRLHLIDRLLHAVARQVDWDSLARAYVERLLRARGLRSHHLAKRVIRRLGWTADYAIANPPYNRSFSATAGSDRPASDPRIPGPEACCCRCCAAVPARSA